MNKAYIPVIFIGAIALIFISLIVAVIVLPIQPELVTSVVQSEKPTVEITLYAGELSESKYGYGFTADSLASPGPLLRFKTTDIVQITFINIGRQPHGFLITDAPRLGSNPFFNAVTGSAEKPVYPGQKSTIIFHPERTGSYFYISPVRDDINLGMWGDVQVPIN